MEKRRELKPEEIKQIDPDYIKGLKFRDAEKTMNEKEGRKVWEYKPFERDLTVNDIIGASDYGDYFNIVTGDGQRYRLEKKREKKGR